MTGAALYDIVSSKTLKSSQLQVKNKLAEDRLPPDFSVNCKHILNNLKSY